MKTLKFAATDIEQMEQRFRTNFVNSLTGFKSGNLVGTINARQQTNLAVFSNVVHIGAYPPLIGLIQRPTTVSRHSYENLKSTGYFTLNHIHPSFFKKAHQTAARYPAGTSEFEAVQLTPFFSTIHPAPYVKESLIKIGLKFEEEYLIRINDTRLVIGRIIETLLPEDFLLTDGFVDCERAESVTICGLDSYHQTQRLARLTYAKPDQALQEIS